MTKSALLVGILSACQFAPILALTLVAGTLIDRYPMRRILMLTQTGFLVLGVIMTVIVLTGIVQYWMVLLIALGYGCLQSFDTPTRQSFVVELVDHKRFNEWDLPEFHDFQSRKNRWAQFGRPMDGEILSGHLLFSRCDVLLSRVTGFVFDQARSSRCHPFQKTGLRRCQRWLALCMDPCRHSLECDFDVDRLHLNYNNNVIIPIFAKEVLHSGAQTYANLLSATGIGSLIAAFLMSYLSRFGLRRDFFDRGHRHCQPTSADACGSQLRLGHGDDGGDRLLQYDLLESIQCQLPIRHSQSLTRPDHVCVCAVESRYHASWQLVRRFDDGCRWWSLGLPRLWLARIIIVSTRDV